MPAEQFQRVLPLLHRLQNFRVPVLLPLLQLSAQLDHQRARIHPIHRLETVIENSQPKRLLRVFKASIAADHDKERRPSARPRPLGNFQSLHSGHADVDERHIRLLPLNRFPALDGVRISTDDLKAALLPAKHPVQALQRPRLVVNQNCSKHVPSSFRRRPAMTALPPESSIRPRAGAASPSCPDPPAIPASGRIPGHRAGAACDGC